MWEMGLLSNISLRSDQIIGLDIVAYRHIIFYFFFTFSLWLDLGPQYEYDTINYIKVIDFSVISEPIFLHRTFQVRPMAMWVGPMS